MISQKEAATQIFNRNAKFKIDGILESVSGRGSCVKLTEAASNFITEIIKEFDIKSVSDCPCGDLNWIKYIDFKNIQYTGYDIVDEQIENNKKNFPEKKFIVFDAINQILPKTDLIISRDFLFHLYLGEGKTVLDNYVKSGSKYLLTTSFNGLKRNQETDSKCRWFFRRINLNIEPYSLIKMISSRKEYQDKSLNLYQINDT